MSYNKGYELGFDGYNNETGCIDLSAGFLRIKEDRGITYLEITKEQYNGSKNVK
ncbi:hypothetical protein RBG61_00345 [Paludicola sp. MB14-C6]|uniref:hypothetical protein n=1 Tax=Paludihabitans sp. MB14-C6 TaxID=3070656 RepID=UPI0027DE532A|nr:hypothetical protein [Paludicola sp. MB14-C6]WMJ23141.1 hypothetical protein RBG61_00345 [Paludicola sp. MB14-C6]